MKRPNIYSKPLGGSRKEQYHPAHLDGQYAADLNTYIDYLENELKKTKLISSLPSEIEAGREAKKYGVEMNKQGPTRSGFHELDFYNGTIWLRQMIEIGDLYKSHNQQLNIDDVMLNFRLRLNVEEWGSFNKGDMQDFRIKLHDEQNGLTRFSIDKRWDILSCEILNGL